MSRFFISDLKILPSEVRYSRGYSHTSLDGDVEFIFARNEDQPLLLDRQVVDIAAIGRDYVLESGIELTELLDLEICKGRLCILVENESKISCISDLNEKIVATQLPHLAKNWFSSRKIEANILATNGANEVYPSIGLADATFDVVATGQTAAANKLRILAEADHTSGRLYTTKKALEVRGPQIKKIVQELSLIIHS